MIDPQLQKHRACIIHGDNVHEQLKIDCALLIKNEGIWERYELGVELSYHHIVIAYLCQLFVNPLKIVREKLVLFEKFHSKTNKFLILLFLVELVFQQTFNSIYICIYLYSYVIIYLHSNPLFIIHRPLQF